ncbi:porin [Micromonospora sp. STR1s_5]|nr:porin [Micromonospora sp. STR1s_5]
MYFNVATGSVGQTAGTVPQSQSGLNFTTGAVPLAFVFNTPGVGSARALDVIQRNNMPDFIGALRYDGAWGSAQVAGAVHEIRTGNIATAFAPFAVNGGVAAGGLAPVPDSAYGWAILGGIKVNLPQLAPGDQIWLQGAYGQGAGSFTGIYGPPGADTQTAGVTNRFTINQNDAVVTSRGSLELTESWTVGAFLLHYWNPEWRSALFGTYGQQNFDPRVRNGTFALTNVTAAGVSLPVAANSPVLSSYEQFYGGGSLIWSPVRDLDIGVEVVYQRIWLPRAVVDANKPVAAGAAPRLTSFDDNILARFRVQRDF